MKYIYYTLTFAFLLSCDKKQNADDVIKSGDLKEIKKLKSEIQKEMGELDKEITKLNESLQELDPESKIILVKTSQIKTTLFNHFIEIQANVTTNQNVTINPEFAGILTLNVHEGQRVSKGQIIGKVRDGGLSQQLEQAKIGVKTIQAQLQQVQIQADLAKSAYEKQSKLWAQKIGSEIQFLQAKTNYEAAQKQISAVKSQVSASQEGVNAIQSTLAKTNIIAPFSGVIDMVLTQNGQAVGPASPIVRLVSIDNMKVEADVPEVYLTKVKQGTKVLIDIPAINTKINSQVSLIGEFVNPTNRTFKATVYIPSNQLVKPNLLAKVQFNDYMNPNAFVVPSNIIRIDAEGNNFIFKVSDIKSDKAVVKKQIVTVGQSNKSDSEILQGLNLNDIVVIEGYQQLVNNDKVTIEN